MMGIRALKWEPDHLFPASPICGTPWPNKSITAECIKKFAPQSCSAYHAAPEESCACGIYACFAYIFLLESLGMPDSDGLYFSCLVEAAGKVIVEQCGWRAEIATIIAVAPYDFLLPKHSVETARKAARLFEVPLLTCGEVSHIINERYLQDGMA